MEKKKIVVFYNGGKSISYNKDKLIKSLINLSLLKENTKVKNKIETKFADIYFIDMTYRNLNRFMERHNDFDLGIDVNTDELHNKYPEKVVDDLDICFNWDTYIIEYIKKNTKKIHVYEFNHSEHRINKIEIPVIEYSKYSKKYFDSLDKLKEFVYCIIEDNNHYIKYHENSIKKRKSDNEQLLKMLEHNQQ